MKGIILSKQQMQDMDRRTTQELGVPSIVLMEAAGAKCAEFIKTRYTPNLKGKVLILCGYGNNGGDGFVIARHLHNDCQDLVIALIGKGNMSPETSQNMALCKALSMPIVPASCVDDITAIVNLNEIDLIIDAVYGIGFRGDLPEGMESIVTALDKLPSSVVAIDIASGIEADTGNGKALKADATLAIAYPKYGHFLASGRKCSGELITIPIGIPDEFLPENCAKLLDATTVEYPSRYPDAHKGSYGKVLIIGGSEGYLGSVNLAAKAALRSGAGLVYLSSRKALQAYYSSNPGEIMFTPLPENSKSGMPDESNLAALLDKATTLVIGPGLGLDEYALKVLSTVLQHTQVPTIVDADAITLISRNEMLKKSLSKPNIILTPHLAEFSRLSVIDLKDIQSDPISYLRRFVEVCDARVLLKGYTTIFMDKHETLLSIAGNDGLATGGSGDVLSGIIAAFAAQGLPLSRASITAAYLMGSTAEQIAKHRAPRSILPTDIIENLFMEMQHA